MTRRAQRNFWLLLTLACTAWWAAPVPAAEPDQDAQKEPAPGEQWVRVVRDKEGNPLAMQTAIVRYKPQGEKYAGAVVDLIGAVHIGDRDYYDALNRQFDEYDVVLFELVAPEGTRIERGAQGRSSHPVGAMQNGMKDMLELEHQLGAVDYTKKNFVHADMTPEEFAQSMSDRGEGFMQMFFRMMGMSIAEQSKQQARGKTTDLDMLMALFAPDRAVRLKRVMAEQFDQMESLLVGFSGPDGSTIITERNKKALRVLDEQLKAGKKKIGIFYGAGHMDDMGARLVEEFTLQPKKVYWVDAWNLRDSPAK